MVITLANNCFITDSESPSDLPFSRNSDRKKEKTMVSFTHEQNIIFYFLPNIHSRPQSHSA